VVWPGCNPVRRPNRAAASSSPRCSSISTSPAGSSKRH